MLNPRLMQVQILTYGSHSITAYRQAHVAILPFDVTYTADHAAFRSNAEKEQVAQKREKKSDL